MKHLGSGTAAAAAVCIEEINWSRARPRGQENASVGSFDARARFQKEAVGARSKKVHRSRNPQLDNHVCCILSLRILSSKCSTLKSPNFPQE